MAPLVWRFPPFVPGHHIATWNPSAMPNGLTLTRPGGPCSFIDSAFFMYHLGSKILTRTLSHLHSTDSPVSAPESILLQFVLPSSAIIPNPSHRHRNCMFMSNCGTNSWTPCISLWALGIQGYTNPLPRLCHVQSPLQPFSWKAPSTAHSLSSIVTSRCGLHDQPSSLSSQTCILMAVDCFSKTPHLVSLKEFYQQLFRL